MPAAPAPTAPDAEVKWRYADIARAIGVAPATVRAYVRDGRFPDPDGRDGKAGTFPWWRPATAMKWQAARPGQGVGGGRPRKHPARRGVAL